MAQPWLIQVPLQADELFSTWLARAALAQGCDPLVLTGFVWPRWRAWTVDLDRGLRPDRTQAIAQRAGLDCAVLEQATLRSVREALAPGVPADRAVWPWVLTLGSRNRRRFGGLQYCPQCLADDASPYFRRAWRLAWHVGCARHGCLLADHCDECLAPVEPHRCRAMDGTLCRCASCGHDLRDQPAAPVHSAALAFQAAADSVFAGPGGFWADVELSRPDWFARAYANATRSDQVHEAVGGAARTGLALMLQRTSERQASLVVAYRAMTGEIASVVARQARKNTPRATAVTQPVRKARPEPAMRPRPKYRVEGDWIRLLRRMRVVRP